MLELGHLQGVLRFPIHIMAENDGPASGGISKILVDRRRGVTGAEKHTAELPVLRHREVPHHQ